MISRKKNLNLGFVPATYVKKIDPGLTASQQHLVDNSSVGARQVQIEKQYESIMNLGQERAKKLSETCKAYELVRDAAELSNWIKGKEQHVSKIFFDLTIFFAILF